MAPKSKKAAGKTAAASKKKSSGPHMPRNKELAPGISALSRSKMAKKTKAYKKYKDVKASATPKAAPAVVAPRYYPTEDSKKPLRSRRARKQNPTRLRGSIKPGSVVILVAGRFRGRRVVVLKQLASGLLLVSGPFVVNGVPLRRVDQRYVIATSASVDVSAVDTSKIGDDFFGRSDDAAGKSEADFMEKKKEKKEIDPARIKAQKDVDAALMKAAAKVPFMRKYLSSQFTIANDTRVHELKF